VLLLFIGKNSLQYMCLCIYIHSDAVWISEFVPIHQEVNESTLFGLTLFFESAFLWRSMLQNIKTCCTTKVIGRGGVRVECF
jgi:hypothetical protein